MVAKTDVIVDVLNTSKRGGRGRKSKQRDGEEEKEIRRRSETEVIAKTDWRCSLQVWEHAQRSASYPKRRSVAEAKVLHGTSCHYLDMTRDGSCMMASLIVGVSTPQSVPSGLTVGPIYRVIFFVIFLSLSAASPNILNFQSSFGAIDTLSPHSSFWRMVVISHPMYTGW